MAPAFYMAIAILFPRRVAVWATAIGSAIGETVNILVFGVVPANIALSFVPGIVIARTPEVFIIQRFRQRTRKWLAFGMAAATVYETLAFFLIDWPIYTFTAFYAAFYCTQPPCGSAGVIPGFGLAAFDFGTLIDLAWIPVAFVLIIATRRAFGVQFFE